MKKSRFFVYRTLAAAGLLVFLAAGCDNINRPVRRVSVTPKNAPGRSAPDFRGKVFPDERILEAHQFILRIREEVRGLGEACRRYRGTDEEKFAQAAADFKFQRAGWIRMIDVRLEWIGQSNRPADPNHEINLLYLALTELKYQTENYMAFSVGQQDYNPAYDLKLAGLMREAEAKMQARGLNPPVLIADESPSPPEPEPGRAAGP